VIPALLPLLETLSQIFNGNAVKGCEGIALMKSLQNIQVKLLIYSVSWMNELSVNPLAYTDVPETAGLARSINTQPAVRHNSETNPTSQHNRGMY